MSQTKFNTKKDYYLQKSYKDTEDFFSQINELHEMGGEYSVIAGEMFEQFNMIKLPEIISNVTNIWDTNDINNIPNNVITEIFGHLDHKKIEAIFQKGSSYRLDKIIAFSDDTYGLVSDKSTHHTTLAGDQASGILSLSNLKPNKVCGFWICTNAEVLPRRVGTIFMGPDQEYQVNIVLKSDYIGDLEDQLVRSRDKQFWNEYKQITNTKNNNKLTSVTYRGYSLDGKHQIDWTDNNIMYAITHINKFGKVLHWAEGSMGLGKSILDPWQSAKIQLACFNKKFTNTDVPVNVTAFDKRTNAVQNGRRMIDIKKQLIGDNIYVIWVTDAKDPIDKSQNVPQKQTMDPNKIVELVLEQTSKGMQVEIITLHHHGKVMSTVESDLRMWIPGFVFWEVSFDEYDLLATQEGSAWEVWWTIEPIRRYGSTGTPYTHGKVALWKQRKYIVGHIIRDPKTNKVYRCIKSHEAKNFKKEIKNWQYINHNKMCNTSKYGNRSAVFTFKEAQDAHLIPPLQDTVYQVRLSEIRDTLLKGVKKVKGVPILKTLVTNAFSYTEGTGKNKKEYMLDVETLARMWGILKCLADNPHMFKDKRLLGFSHFLRQAKLAKMNWKWIVNQIARNTMHGRILSNMIIELMQEDSKDPKTNERKRDNAWSHPESLIIVQKIFGRGTDLQFDTGFHFVLKTFRETMQEICRLTRLKRDAEGNMSPAWQDQWRYYIFVVIKNDIDPESPRYDEQLLERLREIFDTHTSAKEELDLIWRSGNPPTMPTPGQPRPFVGVNIDTSELHDMVTQMSQGCPSGFILAPSIETLHTEMLDAMMQLPNPTWEMTKKPVLEKFCDHKIVKDLLRDNRLTTQDAKTYVREIWNGKPAICKKNQQVRYNIQVWKSHLKKFQNDRTSKNSSCLPHIRKWFAHNTLRTPDKLDIKSLLKYLKPFMDKHNIIFGSKDRQDYKSLKTYLSKLIRGTHDHLSDDDQTSQQNWFRLELQQMDKRNQAIIDEATKHHRFGVSQTQDLLHKFPHENEAGIETITSVSGRATGKKFANLDFSQYEAKIQQEYEQAKKIASYALDRWCKHFDTHPQQDIIGSGRRDAGHKDKILADIKTKFGVELSHVTLRTLTLNAVRQKKPKNPNSSHTHTWKHLANFDRATKWHEKYKKQHVKTRQAIKVYYHKHGPALTQKKFASYKLTDWWLRETFGKLDAVTLKKTRSNGKQRNALGQFSNLTNK